MDWIQKHLVIVGVLVVIIVCGVWYGMSGGGAAPEDLLTIETVDTGSPSANSEDQELVETLLTLRAITLSGTIFEDPAFKSLLDFGTTIIPEPVGRPNPFAPINQSASPTTLR